MNLKNISDQALLAHTKSLAQKEREILVEVLHHLREIDSRRLYADLKYRSLFDYATRELGYSEDQAYRRISAMRLMRELPQIEEKIEAGSLSLASLSVAASAFKAQKKVMGRAVASSDKLELLSALEGKSKRESEVVAAEMTGLSPSTLKPEKVSARGDYVELRITGSADLIEKIEKIKGVLAHTHPHISHGELFEYLCDQFLNGREKNLTTQKSRVNRLRLRAKDQCENCGSHFALEVDHIQPRACGGGNESSNLRLLCRSCNQRAAVKVFGAHKVSRFLGK